MLWYGFKKKQNLKINFYKNFKKNKNLKSKILCYNLTSKINFNGNNIYLYLPENWNFLFLFFFKQNFFLTNVNYLYFYSNSYYFNFIIKNNFILFFFNKTVNLINLKIKYVNSFFKFTLLFFKNIFYSFMVFFFFKLKFKGKGYYIFKNFRNTVALQFGYSHKLYVYTYFLFVKFISKTTTILFGINKSDLLSKSFELYNTRTYSIFTSKGIRFSKQIIYKKIGKISSYR